MTRHVHVIGAGLAGLAAALRLSEVPGLRMTLTEAAGTAGGRCRSYHDTVLDRALDNGNHLILSGNTQVLDYVRRSGAAHLLEIQPDAAFPFVDLANAARWTVRIPATAAGMLRADARPPGTGPRELAGIVGFLAASRRSTVAEAVVARGPMWRGFWVPMTTAVLNAPPERASAALLRTAMLRSFFRGAAACRPVLAPQGLGAALVEPALAVLEARGVTVRYRTMLTRVAIREGRADALQFGEGPPETLGLRDGVVLALPHAALARVLPDGVLPARMPAPGMSILNAHFRVEPELARRMPPLLGVLSSAVQWIFRRGDVLSVTVSAAEASPVWRLSRAEALAQLWSEVARAAGAPEAAPAAARLLRERAATFDQSPAGALSRPPARTSLANVVLCGDYVATGLPASLEGAVQSGYAAAAVLSGPEPRATQSRPPV